jgi:hypothetical protein
MGDPLAQINKLIDINVFEEIFFKVFPKSDKPTKKNPNNAGMRAIAPSIIIKTIFLKRLFSLSNKPHFRLPIVTVSRDASGLMPTDQPRISPLSGDMKTHYLSWVSLI